MKIRAEANSGIWTRRQFVRGAAAVVALSNLQDKIPPSRDQARHFAYVAASPDTISVFSSSPAPASQSWSQLQRVSSHSPAYLLLSPTHPVLYVANQVAKHEGVPRGTIEAFRIDPVDGTLTLLGCTPLSLSATHPRHLALSPDGKLLAVAAYGGGIYNLLPVAEDGSLGAPSGLFKDAGCGSHAALQTSAHPHTLIFDSSGKHLLATDLGSDRINVFSIENGKLTRVTQHATGSGSGPGRSVLHPAGFLYAAHELANRLVCYRYDEASGAVTQPSLQRASAGSVALHPTGRSLYLAHEQSRTLQAWHVNAQSGRLEQAQTVSLGRAEPTHVSVAYDGKSVYVLAGNAGSIIKVIADPASGELSALDTLVRGPSPQSLAIRMT